MSALEKKEAAWKTTSEQVKIINIKNNASPKKTLKITLFYV